MLNYLSGTGKTLTGVKLVCWYVHMNELAGKNGESHGQVLYCGPSNSSVDVAASKFLWSILLVTFLSQFHGNKWRRVSLDSNR